MSSRTGSTLSADEALRRLKEGNERFVAGTTRFPTIQKEIRADLTKGQHPYATILCCSDSRVPPELIFDAGLGELFIIRVAGNIMSPEACNTPAAIYAHRSSSCSVIRIAARSLRQSTRSCGYPATFADQLLVDSILPGLADLDPKLTPAAMLAQGVEANVRWSRRQVLESPEGRERQAERRVQLVGAIYAIETGQVRFLE